jgi:hypothetical protein
VSRRVGEQETRRVGEQESRRVGEQESRRVGEQKSMDALQLPCTMGHCEYSTYVKLRQRSVGKVG